MMGRTLAIPIYKALLCFVIISAKLHVCIKKKGDKKMKITFRYYRDDINERGQNRDGT